jgi:phosphatidylglycerol:prolipoprotein diacylglycerol transferase
MALGFVGGLLNWMWLGRRRGYDSQFCSDLMFWVMISGILGARIAYVMENWTEQYAANPRSVFRIDQGGLVFFGGFVASGIAVVIFSSIKKQKLLPLLDFVITSVPLAHALGRIGCFLNGCCFGVCTSLPVGVRFPKGSLPWLEHYSEHLIEKSAEFSCRVHPVQLYESGYNFALYILLVFVFRRSKKVGLVSSLYLVLYSLGRFTLEFFRGDRPERVAVGSLSIGQFVSIPLFVVGVLLLLWLLLKGRNYDED